MGDNNAVSVQQIESALAMLSLEQKQAVRYFLDDLIEDLGLPRKNGHRNCVIP